MCDVIFPVDYHGKSHMSMEFESKKKDAKMWTTDFSFFLPQISKISNYFEKMS